jgi:hypothetical protein
MKLFEKNEGKTDRVIRAILGISAIISTAFLEGIFIYLAIFIGIIFIFTAVTGSCALYSLLKINTKHKSTSKK